MKQLNVVFWDYPQYTKPEYVRDTIRICPDKRLWVLKRFLEHGRIVDTWKFFSMKEIAENLPVLNLPPYAYKKWKRMIEIYGT